MFNQVVIAGFGGQGVLTCGQILALAGMADGRRVTWMPSYGPEQRGGTASCVVTLSDRPIGSPLAEDPNAGIIFNRPSLSKFEPRIKSGGLLLINSSIIKVHSQRADLNTYRVPADEIARRLGLARAANIVMLGSYVAASGAVTGEAVESALRHYLGSKKQHLLGVNLKALDAGRSFVVNQGLAV